MFRGLIIVFSTIIPLLLGLASEQQQLLQLRLSISLSKTAGFAPLMTRAKIKTNMSGPACLIWTSEYSDEGKQCWDSNGDTIWKQITLYHQGVYIIYVSAGNQSSNKVTVEVR